ncbi:hypothetical protein CGCTS75_v003732 [Colletotrichum tropicale]|nr:hypothetical protein CGCTS75_v003732 [Colletotrichum tropicale]
MAQGGRRSRSYQLQIPTAGLDVTLRNSHMLARAAARAVPQTRTVVARRGFTTTRAQMSSPYHYPEGPYSNIPFNPKSKWFGAGFWTYSAVGFFAPFGIAAWQTYKPKV